MSKLLALALTSLALITGIWWNGYAAGVHKWKPIAQHAQAESARNYQAAMAWKGRSEATDKMLLGERKDHLAKLDDASRDCSARVARARADGRAALALMSRPVRVDTKGCPDPALWTKTDIQPSLGGWK